MSDWGPDDLGDETWHSMCVCVTHRRFIPCRWDGPHQFSTEDSDVERVRVWQNGGEWEADT